jgi:integrase
MRTSKVGRRSQGPHLHLRGPRRPGGQARWVIIDTAAKRPEISTGAPEHDRATADKALAAYLIEKHTPNFGNGRPDQVLVTEALAYYGEHKASRTKRRDNIAVSLVMLGKFFADKMVNDITPKLCDDYVAWRIKQGDGRGSNKGKTGRNMARLLKPSTARYDLAILKAAIRFCYEERKLAQNVPVKLPERREPRPRFLTYDEAAWLLAGALGWDRHGKRHHGSINRHLAHFILTGLYTGTRHERILRLQWVENLQGGWVDLDRGILHRRADNEAETKKRAPSVPLADAPDANKLWAHLRRWRRLTTRYVIEHNGSPIESGVYSAWRTACELAGLSTDPSDPNKVTPHTLRHTCVTWMLAAGKTPWQVGKYVGMTADMVERVYGHVNEAMQRETANTPRRNGSGPSQTRPNKLAKRA